MTFEVFTPRPLTVDDLREFDLYGLENPSEITTPYPTENANKRRNPLIRRLLITILSMPTFGKTILRNKNRFPFWLRKFAATYTRPVPQVSSRKLSGKFKSYSYDPTISFALPFSENPIVSIVIPFYNNIDVTIACLQKLQRNQDRTAYEIILVDDASNDFRVHEIYKLRGVKIIRQKENQGYLRSTNLGATFAKGRYIALLNNDTEPLSGWLDELVKAIESEAKLGIAGSRLIDMENRVSEAGSLIFRNQDIWNLGRGLKNEDSAINFSRYVDYCSAAAILVNAQLWQEIGGFDEIFAPAYFEDTDLAMEVWSRGWKVKYIYSSIVKHIEGASHGTDVRVGMKRNQLINRDIFFKKWPPAEYFDWPYHHGPRLEFKRESKGIILVFDQLLPRGDRDAGSFRMERLLAALIDLDFHIVFIPAHPWHTLSKLDSLRQRGIEVHLDANSAFKELLIRKHRIKAIILSRLETFETFIQSVENLKISAPIIFDTVDIQALRDNIALGSGTRMLDYKSKILQREISAMNRSNSTWVVSNVEKQMLIEMDKSLNSDVISWDVNIKEITWRFQKNKKNLLFIGSFGHPPNIEGLTWFVKNVWPILRKSDQKIQIMVCGSGMNSDTQSMLKSNDITYYGWIPDLQPYYLDSGCVIAPLLSGAGLKGKILEAMSFGVPVVTTSIGSEGIALQGDGIMAICDSPQEFAEAILLVINDSAIAERMVKNGMSLLERSFSYNYFKEQISNAFSRLGIISTS